MKTQIVRKIVFIIGILVICMQFSFAQEDGSYLTVKGKVSDNETGKEVVFANVSIADTHIGTVTNIDGGFIIKIKKSLNAKELVFTHIGYKTKKILLSELKPDDNKITLEPAVIKLDEITIHPEDGRKIIEMAIAKVPDNYSVEPINATGFYRETIKQRKHYLSISEAVVDIYKGAYNKEFDEDNVKIYKGRKSSNVKKADTLAVKLQGGPFVSLLLDIVKNPYELFSSDEIKLYNFSITDVKTIDDKLNYEITFTPKEPVAEELLYTGKYYIDVKTLAVSAIDFSVDLANPDKIAQLFVKKKPLSLKWTPLKASYLVNYKERNGKYYFNYSRSELDFKCKWKRKLFNSNYSIMAEMAITDWAKDKPTKFTRKESLKKNNIFEEEVTAFTDENFWGEFNTIEPDQSIQSAIKKYGKKLMREKN